MWPEFFFLLNNSVNVANLDILTYSLKILASNFVASVKGLFTQYVNEIPIKKRQMSKPHRLAQSTNPRKDYMQWSTQSLMKRALFSACTFGLLTESYLISLFRKNSMCLGLPPARR